MKRTLLLPLAALLALSGSACTKHYIANTRVEDTSENRGILQVVEQYRRAMDDRDTQRILELAADEFFEDPGTPSTASDDYDKRGLRTKLEESFAKVQEQRLRIDVRKVEVVDDGKKAFVEYRFDYRYRLNLPNSNEWRDASDLNRVVLKRDGDSWKFISGL